MKLGCHDAVPGRLENLREDEMKKLIVAFLATAVTVTPAAAQWAPHSGPWNPNAFWQGAPANPYERIQFLQDRVNRGVADGSLDRGQASRVNSELNGVRQWVRRMH